jgi:probable addiction module antidote protein
MATKFSAFDAAEYLDNDEAIAAYLNEVIEEDDSDLLLSAISDVARAEHEQGG